MIDRKLAGRLPLLVACGSGYYCANEPSGRAWYCDQVSRPLRRRHLHQRKAVEGQRTDNLLEKYDLNECASLNNVPVLSTGNPSSAVSTSSQTALSASSSTASSLKLTQTAATTTSCSSRPMVVTDTRASIWNTTANYAPAALTAWSESAHLGTSHHIILHFIVCLVVFSFFIENLPVT
jgi:hypothetical protein